MSPAMVNIHSSGVFAPRRRNDAESRSAGVVGGDTRRRRLRMSWSSHRDTLSARSCSRERPKKELSLREWSSRRVVVVVVVAISVVCPEVGLRRVDKSLTEHETTGENL